MPLNQTNYVTLECFQPICFCKIPKTYKSFCKQFDLRCKCNVKPDLVFVSMRHYKHFTCWVNTFRCKNAYTSVYVHKYSIYLWGGSISVWVGVWGHIYVAYFYVWESAKKSIDWNRYSHGMCSKEIDFSTYPS